jgi:SAM-dependent methyltransferase
VAGVVGSVHDKLVHTRRVKRLAELFAALIPQGSQVLDVGCGDGMIDRLIMDQRPDLSIQGVEISVRNETRVPVMPFDGLNIPYPNISFDIVMFVDVLHHTSDPTPLLREAKRVGKIILLKDHLCDGLFAHSTLSFMDWAGNAHHGVPLPYHYLSKRKWNSVLSDLDLKIMDMNESLGLYQAPASWLFDRGLHFIARIESGTRRTKDLSRAFVLDQVF